MTARTRLAATLAAGLVAVACAQAGATAYRTGAVDGGDVIVSGCVIRFSDPDGYPSIHANGAHRCAGVESVGIDGAGRVEVVQTVQGAAENVVLFAQCQTDETLGGARGIICGATGGTDDTSFALYDTRLDRPLDLRYQADRDRVQGPTSNLWVGWLHAPVGGVR